MALAVCFFAVLVSSALGAPSAVPVMQLSALEPASDDPYDDGITIYAEPNPYQIPSYSAQATDSQNTPFFRVGPFQQALANKNQNSWYQPTNSAGGGILHDSLGNKIYFSNLNQLFQNLPTLPLTVNVPDVVNSVSNYFSTAFNRFQQFLYQMQQNMAQLTASAQNIKGDQYYQYGTPSHAGFLSQILHQKPGGNYFKSSLRPESEQGPQVGTYQVIAVMPMYDSPLLRVADYIRQRSMNLEVMQLAEMEKTEDDPAVPLAMKAALKREMSKEIQKEMEDAGDMDEEDVENFAKDVAKEVVSAITVASQKPGKVTEVVVRVDAKNVDDDDDDDDDSISSSEEDSDDPKKKVVTSDKKERVKKPEVSKDSNISDEDDSDSSSSSESLEIPTGSLLPPKKTAMPQKVVDEKKKPNKIVGDDSNSKKEESSEMDSAEMEAHKGHGARPIKAELDYVISKEKKPTTKVSA